ncbi:unnamed protein product [Protopolystoma xenopodis]|uniref:Uncharacterized protein n=1 Tax=Protopolystoma xenopodis TaxID=117903 RepID=A0A448XC29_9PLAT|nr:unnamed protein product [Protopolystoma xenopodis]
MSEQIQSSRIKVTSDTQKTPQTSQTCDASLGVLPQPMAPRTFLHSLSHVKGSYNHSLLNEDMNQDYESQLATRSGNVSCKISNNKSNNCLDSSVGCMILDSNRHDEHINNDKNAKISLFAVQQNQSGCKPEDFTDINSAGLLAPISERPIEARPFPGSVCTPSEDVGILKVPGIHMSGTFEDSRPVKRPRSNFPVSLDQTNIRPGKSSFSCITLVKQI